jgi:hypothetical protein
LAFEKENTNGKRYICNAEAVSWPEFCKSIKEVYGDKYNLPKINEDNKIIKVDVDNSNIIKDLNIKFQNRNDLIKETCDSILKYFNKN